ncbi:MAG: TraB/GumN family protein [Pseudomonadota bacterium]
MRRFKYQTAAWMTAALLALPGAAMAECGGQNLLPGLQQSDPTAHQGIFQRAHEVPNAAGKFWRVEKPGVAPSHLFGTYHDTQAHELVDQSVWDTLAAADGAWFELSLEEQERMQNDMAANPLELIFDMDAPPLSSRIDPSAAELIEEALADRGVPFEAAEQMREWMLVAILGFPACQFFAMQSGGVALDQKLASFGVEKGVPDHGLETYEQALGALESLPFEDFSSMVVEFGASREIEEDMRRTRLALYDAGEIMAISEHGIWWSESQGIPRVREVSDKFLEVALNRRNRAWMEHLVPALEAGNAFVAVGALHLPGDAGLVELLRAEGWTVTRLDG